MSDDAHGMAVCGKSLPYGAHTDPLGDFDPAPAARVPDVTPAPPLLKGFNK